MEAFEGILSAVAGFWFYTIFTHPNKHLNHKIPKIKLKAIEILPNLRIKFKKDMIWVHHWISLSILLAVLSYKVADVTHLLMVKGFILGGAIQGMTFKDRFNILVKNPLSKLTDKQNKA
jgi:hypothetical protein